MRHLCRRRQFPARLVGVVVLSVACGRSPADGDEYVQAEQALRRGDVLSARTWLRRTGAGSSAEQPKAHAWRALLLSAETDLETDDSGPIRQLPKKLEAEPPPGLPPEFEVRRLKVMGQAAQKLGDPQAAERHLRRAMGLPGPRELRGEAAIALASVLSGQRRTAEAEALIRSELATSAQPSARLQAVGLCQLGFMAISRAAFGEALTFLDPALTHARAARADSVVARIQLNRGVARSWLGDFEQARAALQESAAIRQRMGLYSGLRNVWGSLGDTYWLSLEREKAIPYYQRALEVSRRCWPPSVGHWANNLANTYIHLARWDAAERANDEARNQPGATAAVELGATLNAAVIARGRGQLKLAEGLLRNLLAGSAKDKASLWAVESELAPLLAGQGRSAEAERYFQLALQHEEEARLELRTPADEIQFAALRIRLRQEYVDWLVARGRVAEALAAVESSRARVLSGLVAPDVASRNEAKRSWPKPAEPDRLFISYWVAPSRSFAWIIGRKHLHLVELPGEAQLLAAVQAARTFLQRSARDPRQLPDSPMHRLYDLVVSPVLKGGPAPIKRVVIVPDGALFGVPFGALIAPGTPARYWIEDVQIAVAPSLRSLRRRALDETSPRRRVLVVGDSIVTDPDFPRLEHIDRELSAIVQHLGKQDTRIVRGADATPEAYLRAELGRFEGVHFAAHAVANPSSPLDASVILSPGPAGGRLSVRDIIKVRRSLDFVTLSACRGAGERVVSGEGLLGLAWGFLAAGARNVIAGLWDVTDGSTAQLMDHLYAQLALGTDPALALRRAQLSLLRQRDSWSKPYHWAAFQTYLGPGLQGDGVKKRPVTIPRPSSLPSILDTTAGGPQRSRGISEGRHE